LGLSLLNRRYRSRRGYSVHTVTDLRAEDNYTLWLRFDDGLEGRVYLGDLVATRSFRDLSDERRFCRVTIDPLSNAVTWEGGINIDPDVLYRDIFCKALAALH
jgi:hypothetical protein